MRKAYTKGVSPRMRVNTRFPLSIKALPVFHVSVIVGDFLRFPMAHGHNLGTLNIKKRGSILSGVTPFSLYVHVYRT